MKLMFTAHVSCEGPRLDPAGKTVRFDNEARKWVSSGKRAHKTPLTFHPVDVGQGVC